MRAVIGVIVLLAWLAAPAAAGQAEPAPGGATALALSGPQVEGGAKETFARCCKVCRTGKACGDTCISRRYTCRKGPGCACDAGAYAPGPLERLLEGAPPRPLSRPASGAPAGGA